MQPQPLNVGHQIPGRIVTQLCMGCAVPAAPLIKLNNLPPLRVKVLTVLGLTATTGATVQHDNRLACRIA